MASAPKSKVLYVCHNHPAITPGGAEEYALQVYKGMRDASEFDSVFLARSGPPVSITARMHEGRPITMVNDDPNQYFFYTDLSDWDWTFGRSPNKSALTRFFADFLLDQAPDVVHFQHSTFLGYETLRVTRNTLPDVPIVYTLHEFLPICYHDGKMVRTGTYELCSEPSPRRCHECFPAISQQTFFMRERYIKSHLSIVDLFIAPSHFLRERYVEWGIPAEKILFEENGRLPVDQGARPRRRRATASPTSASSRSTRASTSCCRRWRSWRRPGSRESSASTGPISTGRPRSSRSISRDCSTRPAAR